MSSKFTIVALALTALTTGAGAGTLQSRGSVATRQDNLRAAFPDRRGNPDEGDPRLLWDNRDECNYEESSSNINCGVIISTPEQGNSTIFGGTSSSTPKATSPLTTAGATSPLTTTPTPQAKTGVQPTSNDTLTTAIERTGIIVKTTQPIINLTPAPKIGDGSGSQSGNIDEVVGGVVGSVVGVGGLALLGRYLNKKFFEQQVRGEGVRGAAVGDPARARADVVNVHGQDFGNQQQNPRFDVLEPRDMNFREAPGQGNGR